MGFACRRSKTTNQYLMTFLICVPTTAYALMMAWISPAALLLKSKNTPSSYPLSDRTISWVASIVPCTAVPGVLLFGYICHKFGRKTATICLSVPYVICWVIKLISAEPWALITARGIGGLSAGGSFSVVPIYIKEISDENMRGVLGSFLILFQNVGYVLAYLFGAVLEYQTVIWVSLAFPVIHIITFLKMPDSPVFYIKLGKHEKAAKVLAWLRNTDVTDKEIECEVETMISFQKKIESLGSVPAKDLFKSIETRKAIWLGLGLITLEELSGCFALASYEGTIFEMARDGSAFFDNFNPNMQAVFVGCLQLSGSIVTQYFIERSGRKPLLLVTCVVIGICMGLLGAYFFLVKMAIRPPGWLPILFMSLAVFSCAVGLMPVPFVILTEITDFQNRGLIQAISIAYNWILSFLLVNLFSLTENAFGVYSIFWFFSLSCAAGVFYIIFCVPETKGKSLDRILNEMCPNRRKSTTTNNGT